MKLTKSNLAAAVAGLACVGACAAPGLFAVVTFGGLTSLGAVFACLDALWLGVAALAGGGVVYFLTRRWAGEARANQTQCAVPADGKSGCGCHSA